MIKTIAFATLGLTFNGGSLEEKTLGGSESAMIYMARELASFGNIVYVYCPCDKPGEYDGVIYHDINEFFNDPPMRVDVLIMSRTVECTPELDSSNLTIFWMHDVVTIEFTAHAHKADRVFLMSDYQKKLFESVNPAYGDMIHVTKNGFDIDLALKTTIQPFDKRKNNYIFASKPERGLKYLLSNLWPKIIKLNPDAKLHICTYVNDLPMPEEGKKIHAQLNKEINDLAFATDGIIRQGNLLKRDFYKLLGQCAYMVYPCEFPEISCISAIEAQAMGILVVAPDEFALSETVRSPTLVTGERGSAEYDQQFIDYITKYQDKKAFLEVMQPVVDEVRNNYSWRRIAALWDIEFDKMFTERFEKYKPQIFKRLAHNSDYYSQSKVDPNFDVTIFDTISERNLTYEYFTVVNEDIRNNVSAWTMGERSTHMWEKIDEHFDQNKKRKLTVLELGSYDGIMIGHVYTNHKDQIKKAIVYEGLKDAIDANKKNWNPNDTEPFQYINDNLMNLPVYNLKADIIIAGEILEHMRDWPQFLRDIHDCANPGALVVFSTPAGPWSSIGLKHRGQHEEAHLMHFEFLDLMTIFQEHTVDNEFFIKYHNVHENKSLRNDRTDHFTFGYVNNNPTAQFREINYVEKVTKTRPYFSLSVIMITKDEENSLARCLKSVKDIADEIIIVDTGSTDDTKRIAAKFTDNIYDYKWEEEDGLGDFSKARNYSLDKATGDWVFYIDADEELLYPRRVPMYLNSPYYDTICIKQKQLMLDGDDSWDQNANRLFKRNGKHRFYGVIHEFPRLSPTDGYSPLSVTMTTAVLAHYGYVNPVINAEVKLRRNHDLLLKDIKQTPNKLDNYAYLIRDMWYFYKLEQNDKYLYKGLEVYRKFPGVLDKQYVAFKWLDCFKYIQNYRLELISRFNYRFVAGKHLDTGEEVLFESEEEFDKYTKAFEDTHIFKIK